MDFNYIDFDDLKGIHIINKNNAINLKKYDKTTTEIYRIKRQFKIDPLTDQEIPSNLLFEYNYRWDPYTGMIIDEDPIGPLCFNALNLYNYYYLNRFKGLWNAPEGQFEGYYGDLVGAGPDLEIKSRGSNPEKYLFRLPIIDCYLPPEHNFSIITMGPKLSNEDIEKIDKILITRGKNFIKLKNIKENYDCAIINNKKDSRFIKYKNKLSLDLTEEEKLENFNRFNVDKLVRMKNY